MQTSSFTRFRAALTVAALQIAAMVGLATASHANGVTFIHDVQGPGAATPIPGSTVTVVGVVTANEQGVTRRQGFFVQEEDIDADANPATSEGIFVFCNTCSTPVAEGQRVQVTGLVNEFNGATQLTSTSVTVAEAGNHLAEVTPSPLDLPVVGVINDFYEAREGMLVTFADTLTVSGLADLARFGQIELFEGGRPRQFTETASPSVAGNAAYLDGLARRRVIVDDDNDRLNAYLASPTGSQAVFHPRANGGFSVGTQGTDFFRSGDVVTSLTGVLDWSTAGALGTDAWRIRPTAARPVTFTVANPRPASPPAVGGAIRAANVDLADYFTTIDTTASSAAGPCGPTMTQDCAGADSAAELNRQRERLSIELCALNPHVATLTGLENTTPTGAVTDLLGAVNSLCGGANPYAFVNTGGTLGTTVTRVEIVYRTGKVSPVGAPLVDLDPTHERPPTAQTFDVIDVASYAFGERFTVVAVHGTARGCDSAPTGSDADAADGQGCFNARRTAQASRLLSWLSVTVLPAAGDTDVLLLGDFNALAKETPTTTLAAGGYTDLLAALGGANPYTALLAAQLAAPDHGFASTSLAPKVTGAAVWHINADEADLFDYNDQDLDVGEVASEEKPDGATLMPMRVVFQPASAYRAGDRDPVLVGLFKDTTPPTCAVTAVRKPGSSGRDEMDVTVRDVGSGLQSITITLLQNGTVAPPSFTPGTTNPVVVTAVKTQQGVPTRWALDVVDMAGNVRHCT